MRIDGSIPPAAPSIPFNVARAYGASGAGQVQGSTVEARASRVSDSVVIGKVGPAAPVAPSAARLDAIEASGARELVAGQVPGKVDFSGAQPRPSVDSGAPPAMPAATNGALPMYRAPWDRNAAATAVQVGRSLDVNG